MPQDTGVGRNVVLDGLDFASLRRVWEQTFGAAPPSSLSRVFLRRVLAYERQCRTHGGHSAATRRILATMVNGTPGNGAAAPAGSVSAGTHLVREWNGLPIPPRSLSQSKYSCVDPPPPSTLISRGEVSQRCWHRGISGPTWTVDKQQKALLNYWAAISHVLADGDDEVTVLFKTNGLHLFHAVSPAVFLHLANRQDFKHDTIVALLKHGFDNLPTEFFGMAQPQFWHRGDTASGLNQAALRKYAQALAAAINTQTEPGEIQL